MHSSQYDGLGVLHRSALPHRMEVRNYDYGDALMGLKKIVRIFQRNNVIVVGLPRRGKDMLIGNVIARRKKHYVSNTDYNCKDCKYIKLDFSKLNLNNNFRNFISGNINRYEYPYPIDADIYVADAGVYLPAQYCSDLNKMYPEFPTFFALIGHLTQSKGRMHANIQNLNRLWDKWREMADVYITANWCKVVFGKIVIQRVTIYDKYNSCVDRVKPYRRIRIPLFASKEMRACLRQKDEEMRRLFQQNYGSVKSRLLIYVNKSKYNTHIFKEMLANEKK